MDICPPGQRGVRFLLLTRAEPFAIANGLIIPEAKITVKFNALNEESECIEMNTAVRAISVGRRCQMHGYRFVWEPWASVPSFQTPEGEFVDVIPPFRPSHFHLHGTTANCKHWPAQGLLHAGLSSAD